jgi:hypothetical protein
LRGIRELRAKDVLPAAGRVRQPGGGRKPIEAGDRTFTLALERIMEVNTAATR